MGLLYQLVVRRKGDDEYRAGGAVTVPLYTKGNVFTVDVAGTQMRVRVHRRDDPAEGSSDIGFLYVDEI
jgi:hypothetical protein